MQIYLLGDFKSDNGPGNANKQILESLTERLDVSYSKKERKFVRVVETIVSIARANILMICSRSKINYLAIIWSKFLKRKTLYILHGLSSYEEKINNPGISEDCLKKMRKYENFVFKNADKIICVSKYAMDFLKMQFPMYADKIMYIYNTIDLKTIQENIEPNSCKKGNYSVLSVGGGIRRKNNLTVSKALEVCVDKGTATTFTVVGDDAVDGKAIKSYPFVKWINYLPHDELNHLMRKTNLYIQNSTFETFGLAIIEALYAGCDLLISANVGCKDLFTTLEEGDLIYNVNDVGEISSKIIRILKKGNNQRLRNGFSENMVTKDWQADKFIEIINSL